MYILKTIMLAECNIVESETSVCVCGTPSARISQWNVILFLLQHCGRSLQHSFLFVVMVPAGQPRYIRCSSPRSRARKTKRVQSSATPQTERRKHSALHQRARFSSCNDNSKLSWLQIFLIPLKLTWRWIIFLRELYWSLYLQHR